MEKGYIRRRNYLVDWRFQTNFVVKFCFVVIAASLIIGFLIVFLTKDLTTVTIENTKVLVKSTSDFMLPIITLTVIFVNLFTAIAVIMLTVFTSHKIAGPLFRIKREIGELEKGNMNANFKIRKNDPLQDLASSLTSLADSLRNKYTLLKDKTSQLRSVVEASPDDSDAINARLKELDGLLSQINI